MWPTVLHHTATCSTVDAPRVVGRGQQRGIGAELALHWEAHGRARLPRGRDHGRGHLHARAARVAAKDVPRQLVEALACPAQHTGRVAATKKSCMCIKVHVQPLTSDINLPALPGLTSMLQPQRRSIFQNTIAAGLLPTCAHELAVALSMMVDQRQAARWRGFPPPIAIPSFAKHAG